MCASAANSGRSRPGSKGSNAAKHRKCRIPNVSPACFAGSFRAHFARFPRRNSADFPPSCVRIFGAQFLCSRAKTAKSSSRLFRMDSTRKTSIRALFKHQIVKDRPSPRTVGQGLGFMDSKSPATGATTPTRAAPVASGKHCSADPERSRTTKCTSHQGTTQANRGTCRGSMTRDTASE